MTTTTERRAGNEYEVGQRYLVSDGNTREVTLSGVMPNGCGSGCVTHARWKEPHGGMNGGCLTSDGRGFVGVYMKRIDVPAAAPLAADRTGCKPWCGNKDVPFQSGQQRYWQLGGNPDMRGQVFWCSRECRDARLPPLAAQPAETPIPPVTIACVEGCGRSKHNDRGAHAWMCAQCSAKYVKPAPQPAPAKVEQPGLVVAAPCDDCGETDDVEWFQFDNMTRVYCQPCRIGATVWMAAQTGTPYTGPERLERSKLAHSYGVECPTLEDC